MTLNHPCRPPLWSLVGALAALACVLSRADAQTDGSARWAYTALSTSTTGSILSSPAVARDGTVYFGVEIGAASSASPGGQLVAVTAAGALKWVFQTTDWVDSTPAVGSDGTVYFGSWDANVYALRPDGSLKWKFRTGAFVSSSPALGADGAIYIGAGDGNLYALNPDGSLRWFFPTLYWIDAPPAVAPDGTIYVGSLDNTFYAINPNGTEKWHFTAGNDITTAPAIAADGTVYFGSRDSRLYALNADGTLKWSFSTPDTVEASVVLGDDGTVYVPTTGGRVYALRPDGTEKWRYPAANQPTLNALYSTPAVRADGSVLFGSSNNALYALRADGALLWRSTLGDWADSSPLVAPDGSIYIGSYDKKLYAFNGTIAPSMTDWPQLNRDPLRTAFQPLGAASGTAGRLVNLSVRTFSGTDADTLIVGFVVGGSGGRSLLVRGVGPSLAGFGVTGVLANPRITAFSGSTSVASNDDWGSAANASAISSTATAVGAFPLPAGSLDAALFTGFNVGGYTVQVGGAGNSTGVALMEAYDAAGSTDARLVNVSARSAVGPNSSGVLIAGFVVGQNTRALLVRGIGPALAPFGVGGAMTNPQLRIFQGSQLVAENNDWSSASNATTIASAAGSVGAFPLPAGSRDAALLLTLPPAAYTAQVSGVNGTTGVALIEVYEVR